MGKFDIYMKNTLKSKLPDYWCYLYLKDSLYPIQYYVHLYTVCQSHNFAKHLQMKTRILTVGALLKQMQLTLLSFYTEVMTRKFYSDGQQFHQFQQQSPLT
jgi:hypothetical protein